MNRRILLLVTLLALTLADPSSANLSSKTAGAGDALSEEKVLGAAEGDRSSTQVDTCCEREDVISATVVAEDFGGDLTCGWPAPAREARQRALELRRIEQKVKSKLSQGPLAGAREIRWLLDRKFAVERELSGRVRTKTPE